MRIWLMLLSLVVAPFYPGALVLTVIIFLSYFVKVSSAGPALSLADCQRTVQDGVFLNAGVGGFVETVGESNYMPALISIHKAAGSSQDNLVAVLTPEMDNPYDKNAVAVYLANNKVGYLSKQDAKKFRKVYAATIQLGKVIQCWAKLSGGTASKKNIGVLLSFNLDEEQVRKTVPKMEVAGGV